MTQSTPIIEDGAPSSDLGPLTWVLPDLRKSLPLAVNAVRQYLLELKPQDASVGASVQFGNLKDARRLFYQARSALEMIGLNVAARLLTASDSVVKIFSETPAVCTEGSLIALEKAQAALLEFLDALLKGRNASPLGLFPQYRGLLELLDGQRVHPADLWVQKWSWREVHPPEGLSVAAIPPRRKTQLVHALLKFLNTGESAAAGDLKSACISMLPHSRSHQTTIFWLIAAGFFEACEHGLVPLDVYAKRTASQLLQQLSAAFQDDATDAQVLAQDATFFCMRASTVPTQHTPLLSAVKSAYSSLGSPKIDYNQPRYGKYDPIQVEFLRRRLASLSESWSALVGGDSSQSDVVLDSLQSVTDILPKLSPETAKLVGVLRRIVDLTIKPGAKPNPLLAMEVATTLLYLEAVYDDVEASDEAIRERIDILVRRLVQVTEGGTPAVFEPWMEALYRRLSERQRMGSVTSELRITLAAVEAALEKYLHNPLDSAMLSLVSGHLSQMHGVFSVLGLQQAVNAVFKIREILDTHLAAEKRNRPIPLQLYEQIARSVSTMGFLVDMLNYQIEIAKEVFVYDAQAGEFRYLNGRGMAGKRISLPMGAKPESQTLVVARVPAIGRGLESKRAPHTISVGPKVLGKKAPVELGEDDDVETLTIFLDETTSIVEDARRALPALDTDPTHFDHILLVRRAFHTLKGSARMVGLTEFGEAAWAFEQLMNQWIEAHKKPTNELISLIAQALAAFSNWSQAIRQRKITYWTEAQFRASADAMRVEARLLPLWQAEKQLWASDPTQNAPISQGDLISEPLQFAQLAGSEQQTSNALPTTVDLPMQAADIVSDHSEVLVSAMSEVGRDGMTDSGQFEILGDIPAPVDLVASAAMQVSPSAIPADIFDIFISETAQWAKSLSTCLSDWQYNAANTNIRAAEALAHSIRGNAAAVGVHAIAELAQAIEQTIGRMQPIKQVPEKYIALFKEAAASVQAMVEYCAVHRTALADPAMLTRLDALDATVLGQAALLAGVQEVNGDTQLSSELVDPGVDLSFFSASGSTLEPIVGFESSPQAKPKAQTEEMEDRLDSQDELDYDLLPVFQEEAVELLPALGLALRQWVAHLGDAALRANTLRLLHTLKGSGRLIGAFRLGELAHRMESEIEQLPSHDLSRMHLEPLLARFDRLQALFEVLGEDRKENLGPTSVDPSIQNDTAQHDHALMSSGASPQALRPLAWMASGLIRVRTSLVERLVDGVGEVSVYRSHAETHLAQMGNALGDLNLTLDRLATQLRELELQADMHIQSRNILGSDAMQQFDPLEFDRFTRLQEIARMMTEAVGDVSTVRRNVLNALSASQHDLEQQSRQLRQLQRDLLRMRLVEFEVIADRLYSVVRLAAKELGKQVVLELQGGEIDLDRSVLERMTPSFEHLLRNAVAHGIESTDERSAAGKSAVGAIKVVVNQEGNDVAIQVSDDGRGFSLKRIREKAMALGLIAPGEELDREATIKILFTQGFSTVGQVTELAGRGIGLDVVLSEVRALGGRIETQSEEGVGTTFKLVFPLTTAVTQVLIFRVGEACFGIPVGLVQAVARASPNKIKVAYEEGEIITEQGQAILFYGSGPLLQIKQDEVDIEANSLPLLILRSAGQGLALHVDEVLGNREVVVKNMGPQLSRLPGLAGIAILPSGEPILIYNPIALANVYGNEVRKAQTVDHLAAGTATAPVKVQAPLILVVDDALTVRRVIERLLLREGYRVALANDGVHALQVLEQQRPLMVLSDIEMPRMDGFELARSIRSRPEYADLPIVMITSRIAQKHRDHAMSLGVNHYLGKPYSESALLGLIRDQVQASGIAAELHQALNV